MTEKQLYEYLYYDRRVKRLVADLKEYEKAMCSPNSPNIKGIPGGNGDDRIHDMLDRKTAIARKIEEYAALRAVAERRLDKASAVLETELQIDLFELLYRKGLDVKDAAKELTYSAPYIYQLRKIILELIKDISA